MAIRAPGGLLSKIRIKPPIATRSLNPGPGVALYAQLFVVRTPRNGTLFVVRPDAAEMATPASSAPMLVFLICDKGCRPEQGRSQLRLEHRDVDVSVHCITKTGCLPKTCKIMAQTS